MINAHHSFDFENAFFTKLSEATKNHQPNIAYIAKGGMPKGDLYKKAIGKFTHQLENDLSSQSIFTKREMLYITNALFTDSKLFDLFLESNKFDTFIFLITKHQRLSIYKNLFGIYFNYYFRLYKHNRIEPLKLYLKSILRKYNGKNKYINKLQSLKDKLFLDPQNILEHYKYDFEHLKCYMKLYDDYEFSKVLLNFKIVQDLKNLAYDEENKDIFATIEKHKEMYFDAGLLLKEFVAKVLIERAILQNQPFPNWQSFILSLIGDPRSISSTSAPMRTWNAIGEENKEFFIKTLSKDDLKLFLESLSDSVSDTNYHYRKAFWMQFLDKVLFAKVMIGTDVALGDTLSDIMKEKLKSHNESYGKLKGTKNQSGIYIDFGKIKIIEFTHNGQMRGFSECPINLTQSEPYRIEELRSGKEPLFSIIHSSPTTYTWQKNALYHLNEYLNTNIKMQDIEIPEDKHRREEFAKRHEHIRSYLNQ